MEPRLRTAALTALACLAAVAAPVVAAEKGEAGPGYVKTSNVEHVMTLPLDTDSIGGRVFDGDFFLRTAKGVSIYDTSNPELPLLKGFVAVPATPNQERENIDTNGKLLITGQSIDGILYVVDVANRTTPRIVSVARGAADHTNTCVLDCTFVYGSEGTITDLTDPANPKVLPRRWFGPGTEAGAERVNGSHDLTEVAPGLLVTASNPVLWIDASEPAEPRVVARGDLPDRRYMHGMEWPRGGQDRFLLGGSETIDTLCQSETLNGTFVVWDTAGVKQEIADPEYLPGLETPVFERKGQYTLTKGLPTDMRGQAPASQHCGHWFDPHPQFEDGGLVAMAWYTYGVRFLEVLADGTVEERGFWQPLPGVSSSVYWVSEDVVWVTDYTARGLDVLKLDREAPAETDAASPGQFVEAGSAEERRAADLIDAAHDPSHHTGLSVAEITDAWVCKPVGGPAPLGRPTLAAGLLAG